MIHDASLPIDFVATLPQERPLPRSVVVLEHRLGVDGMRARITEQEVALRAQFVPPYRLDRADWAGDRLVVRISWLGWTIDAAVVLQSDRLEIGFALPVLLLAFEPVVAAQLRMRARRLLALP